LSQHVREVLAQLNVHPLGLVTIGDDGMAVPYVPPSTPVLARQG